MAEAKKRMPMKGREKGKKPDQDDVAFKTPMKGRKK